MHSPSQLCPQTFLHDLTLLKIRLAPSPRSPWLAAHPHIYVCLLSVFRSPLNCALAGQTHSTRPKTQREKVIKFPHLCQTCKTWSSLALWGSYAVAQSKMLELVNMSYNIIIRLWGTDTHKSWEGPGTDSLPSWWSCLNTLFFFFFFETIQLELASIKRLTPLSYINQSDNLYFLYMIFSGSSRLKEENRARHSCTFYWITTEEKKKKRKR